jgi:acetyl-CoA C-acetyltransferase
MGGSLASLDATDLGGHAIEAALERSGVEPEQVQQVVFGQVLQAGQGQIPSRQAQIKGGIPKEVPSETINKVCASGMRTIGIADMAIRAGDTEVTVTGGMESMSNAPYLLPGARFGFRMGDVSAVDSMTHDGLTNPFTGKQMINEASEVSNELEITRVDMDRFAERSHRLAAEATDAGRLADEISAVTVRSRKGESTVETDEAIRPDTTLETLAKLKAIGGDDATHTAGNAPGVNDGAGAIVVASEEWARSAGRTPLARILSYGTVADDFPYLAKTPANAAKQALEKIGKSPEDVDLWEINEAFASVALNSVRMLGVDEDRVNVNGGAIALGHPIGASGSRIVGSLVHELQRRGGGLGVAAICSGGGQGDAIVIEVDGS